MTHVVHLHNVCKSGVAIFVVLPPFSFPEVTFPITSSAPRTFRQPSCNPINPSGQGPFVKSSRLRQRRNSWGVRVFVSGSCCLLCCHCLIRSAACRSGVFLDGRTRIAKRHNSAGYEVPGHVHDTSSHDHPSQTHIRSGTKNLFAVASRSWDFSSAIPHACLRNARG